MLVRLSPFPEELDRGYLGRLMRFNGYSDAGDFIRYATKVSKLPLSLPSEAIPLVALSAVAGKTTEEFTRFHTSLPFRRAITNIRPDVAFGSLSCLSMLRSTTTRARQKLILFCNQCALEDLQFHGVSYWRRDHQITGQVWCPKHRVSLSFVTKQSEVLKSPYSIQARAPRIEEDLVEKAIKNAAVNRFLNIAGGLVHRKRSLIGAAASTELRVEAKKQGLFSYGKRDADGLMSEFIRSSYPEKWLEMIVPGLTTQFKKKAYEPLDGVLSFKTRMWPSMSYLLIAAALYESSDDAIEKLMTCEERWSGRSWWEIRMAELVTSTANKKDIENHKAKESS